MNVVLALAGITLHHSVTLLQQYHRQVAVLLPVVQKLEMPRTHTPGSDHNENDSNIEYTDHEKPENESGAEDNAEEDEGNDGTSTVSLFSTLVQLILYTVQKTFTTMEKVFKLVLA